MFHVRVEQADHSVYLLKPFPMNSLLGGASAASFVIGWWVRTFFIEDSSSCPACTVTCGSLTCPTVYCANSSSDLFGPFISFGIVTAISIVALICAGKGPWFDTPVSAAKGSPLDGRRAALGQSTTWKPLPG